MVGKSHLDQLPLPEASRWKLRTMKRFMYSQLSVLDGLRIAFGREQPALHFQVLASPPSIYINYAIREEALANFTRFINLAPGFSPCPISCVQDDQPRHVLTLNIYQVTGLVQGVRAEWSTYVLDKAGIPRYMVLEARASSRSLEPVKLFTRADCVVHQSRGQSLYSKVTSDNDRLLESRVTVRDRHRQVTPTQAWISANDYIYWRNGICDKIWYDSSVMVSPQRVPPEDADISDGTHWAQFTEAEPINILLYDSGMNFIVSPWFNI